MQISADEILAAVEAVDAIARFELLISFSCTLRSS
jgi:hypothetical protein